MITASWLVFQKSTFSYSRAVHTLSFLEHRDLVQNIALSFTQSLVASRSVVVIINSE